MGNKLEKVANVGGIVKADANLFTDMEVDQVVSLTDGEAIKGVFRGMGDGVEVDDMQKPGESRIIKTWRIQIAPGRIAQVVSSAQLDRRMASVQVGAQVAIARLGVGKTRKGNPITRYVIGVKNPQTTMELESPDKTAEAAE